MHGENMKFIRLTV